MYLIRKIVYRGQNKNNPTHCDVLLKAGTVQVYSMDNGVRVKLRESKDTGRTTHENHGRGRDRGIVHVFGFVIRVTAIVGGQRKVRIEMVGWGHVPAKNKSSCRSVQSVGVRDYRMQNNSIPLDMLNTTLALSHYILQHGGVDTLEAAPARLNDQRNRTAGPATMKYTQKQGHGCCTSGTM